VGWVLLKVSQQVNSIATTIMLRCAGAGGLDVQDRQQIFRNID
jgi:hypothetical protein